MEIIQRIWSYSISFSGYLQHTMRNIKNTNKGKSLDCEYLKSLLYWCEREFISKQWNPKNALIYQYALCTDIFYWPVNVPFFREHHI